MEMNSDENELNKIKAELANVQNKLEQAYMDSIETLRYTVDAKDSYTKGHSERVSEYSVLIGKYLINNLYGNGLRTLFKYSDGVRTDRFAGAEGAGVFLRIENAFVTSLREE